MKRIKINERQANLLKDIESTKKIKVTKEQLDRLFEVSVGAQGVTNNFKKEFKRTELKPKFEGTLNESFAVDFIEFAQHVLGLLKEILTDPSTAGLDPFWVKMGVTRGEMFGYLADAGIIGTVFYNGVQKYEIYKKNFKDKLKFLYYLYTGERVDDKEKVDEADGGYPAGAANHPSAPYNEPRTNKTNPIKSTGEYKAIAMNNEIIILKNKTNDLFVFYYEGIDKKELEDYASRDKTHIGTADGEPDFEYGDFDIDSDVIESYINNNLNKLKLGNGFDDWYGDAQLVKIDDSLKNELLNFYGKDGKIVAALNNVGESTGAASSGSFVAPMSIGSVDNGKSPAEEMKNVIGEVDNNPLSGLVGLELGDNDHNYFKVKEIRKKTPTDKGIERALITLTQDGQLIDSHLLFQYNPHNGVSALLYNKDYEKLLDAEKAFPIVYHDNLAKISEILKKSFSMAESTGAASSGAYVQPKIWAKDEKNWRNAKKPAIPNGKIVDPTTDMNMQITENEVKKSGKLLKEFNIKQAHELHKKYDKNYDNKFATIEEEVQDGGQVSFDDCTLFNNNKEAENGKCSVGAVDDVVKIKKT